MTLEDLLRVVPLAALVSAVTTLLTLAYSRSGQREQNRYQIERTLIERRIDQYSKLMSDLASLSFAKARIKAAGECELSDEIQHLDQHDVTRAIHLINRHIYGETGLLASHETREMIIRLRTVLEHFNRRFDAWDVTRAAWKVHQMLRADLGVTQPVLMSALDKVHRRNLHVKGQDIDRLAGQIEHVDWGDILGKSPSSQNGRDNVYARVRKKA